jgi:predicted amidophosphoribosyltransferase
MGTESYSRTEVLAAGNALPERGPLCHECGARIPAFEELAEADERRIRQLIRDGRSLMAMEELRAATGCSLPWAKLWVQHGGRPKPAEEPTPCPYCGEPLRTSLAKQCRHCRRDWHDPESIVALGDS